MDKLKEISFAQWFTIIICSLTLATTGLTLVKTGFQINLNKDAIAAHDDKPHLSQDKIELLIIEKQKELIEEIKAIIK